MSDFHASITVYDFMGDIYVGVRVYDCRADRGPDRLVLECSSLIQGEGQTDAYQWARDALVAALEAI